MHNERSMTKREFEDIAEATLEQYDIKNYNVVMIYSPVDAIVKLPELSFYSYEVNAYTGENNIYYLWYKLKNMTYTYQLSVIRHETAHAMQKTTSIDPTTGAATGNMNEWREILNRFSMPKEEKHLHDAEIPESSFKKFEEEIADIWGIKKAHKKQNDALEALLDFFDDVEAFFSK